MRRATSGGEALPQMVRAFFEPRFGEDLSHVRIHRDADAVASARALGAKAYALGSHIAFGSGRFAPGTEAGDRLIAHEIAHVLQGDVAGPIRREPDNLTQVKRVASREVLEKQRHLNAVEAMLEKRLNKRRADIEATLTQLGPNPKAEGAKMRRKLLQADLDKDLAAIRENPDSKPVHRGLRADILKSARSRDAAKREVDTLTKLWSQYDEIYASDNVAAKLGTSLTPAQLKALIGQESGDLTLHDDKGDIAGIAQMTRDEEKRAGGKSGDRKIRKRPYRWRQQLWRSMPRSSISH